MPHWHDMWTEEIVMDDPNINPAWDALLGHETDSGTMRLMGLIVAFLLAGGTLFWLVG